MRRKLSEADPEKLASELTGLQRLRGEKLNQHFKIIYRGIRIVRLWSAIARDIDCRIHHVA